MKKILFILLFCTTSYSQSTKTVFGECGITDYGVYYTVDLEIKQIHQYTKTIEVWKDNKKIGEIEPIFLPNQTYTFKVKRI